MSEHKTRPHMGLKGIGIILVVALLVIQFFQVQSISGKLSFLEERDSSLITEIGQLKENFGLYGDDINEVRRFLGMEVRNYAGFDEIESEQGDEAGEAKDLQLALFEYVDYISVGQKVHEKVDSYSAFLEGLSDSDTFESALEEYGLEVGDIGEDDYGVSLSVSDDTGFNYIFFYLSKEEGVLYQKLVDEKTEVEPESAETFEASLTAYLDSNFEEMKAKVRNVVALRDSINSAIESEEVENTLDEKDLKLETNYTDKDFKYTWSVLNQTDEVVAEIVMDVLKETITLVDKNNEDLTTEVNDISTGLEPFIKSLNSKTVIERKVDESLAELQETFDDKGFQLLLQESGLKLAVEPREDDERIYYDLFTNAGDQVSSIVVEKTTGVINIVDPEGTNSENLLFFDPDYKKKTLELPDQIPDYGDKVSHDDGTFNILIAGKHGNLVDTMIFTHVDEVNKKIKMISVPRDLNYNGRKINSFPYYYGMPELKKVLSDLTGYELDKYILIDMYAFIDVIDLIGGIDIHLDKAVIDPTYRTVDNGVVGTLHYEPGDYHLGGVEALRLARSRHTSSDFARAERQQLILKSLQDKARNFGFGDADTLYEIARSVLNHTETDISIDEAISFYFKYQNYDIESNVVMSSGNVLYVPPYITIENCNAQIAAGGSSACLSENHAYTLVPRNNDWNTVKWFFERNFEEAV